MTYDFEELTKKCGGTFRFTTLLIRRSRELAHGAPKAIVSDLTDPAEIAIEEFVQGKLSFIEISSEKK